MRRSRTALTLFLGALAAALQSAGFVNMQRGMATEPAAARLVAANSTTDCYAAAPRDFDDWWRDTDPGYKCQGSHGADCFHGPAVSPRIHLEDISDLVFDPRHSSGQEEVLRINRENEGLQAASLSTGDFPHDLPAGEALYISAIAHSRVSAGFDYDDVYHYYGACEYDLDEPSDLPAGETVLHVARQSTAAAYHQNYREDYEYDYSDDYYSYDEESYAYDDYSSSLAANASRAALPAFIAGSLVEAADLPPGEQFIGDLPPGEVLNDDLPPGEEIADDMPPGENIADNMPPGESFDDLPPCEIKDDLPPAEFSGEDLPPYEVVSSDLPPGEDISDLPPAELGCTAPASITRGAYAYDDYDCGYSVHCYGDYADCDEWHNRSASYKTGSSHAAADNSSSTGQSLLPLLRTASWMLNHMSQVLLGLSKSCDQIADGAAGDATNDSVHVLPAQRDYPWPTIIGRQPQRDQTPGL